MNEECGGLQEEGIVGKVGGHWDKMDQGSVGSGVYLTIRRRARGFYRLIVGEGRSPKPTIKGDRNRERAV